MRTNDQVGSSPAKSGLTPVQVYVTAVVCLLGGISVGYLLRSPANRAAAGSAAGISLQAPAPPGQKSGETVALQKTLEGQVAPLLQELNRDPKNPDLLAKLGDLYYDAHQFQQAIAYYGRALQLQPGNTSVRTDMGTAYWYLGDADRAIAELRTVLQSEPAKADTLFNLGIVQWQGKADVPGAVATWQKLLDTNPAYENRDKVKSLIAEAQKHGSPATGTGNARPAE
jgi:cytochrome c-type biogenesis protein CcmH/NrfG